MVYGRYNWYNYSIHGGYKPTYNWGAPSSENDQFIVVKTIVFQPRQISGRVELWKF